MKRFSEHLSSGALPGGGEVKQMKDLGIKVKTMDWYGTNPS